MRKITFWTCLMLLFGIFACSVLAQNEPASVFKADANNPEPKKQSWNFSSEFTATNKVETDNKIGMVESPLTAYTSKFTNSTERRDITLESTVGFTMRNVLDDRYVNFRIEVKRKFTGATTLSADSQFAFTRFNSVGRVGAKLAKMIGGEKRSIEPFTKIDFYFPLGNQPTFGEFGHRGVTWSNGLIISSEFRKFVFESKNQFILDSGAVIPGQRGLFNTEFRVGYKVNQFCFGPIFDYTRLVTGRFPQRNSFVAGMFVRYR